MKEGDPLKILRQILILLSVTLAGEALSALLPLPIPASIYGIVLLFALLQSGLLRTEAIREISSALIAVMPLLFIPACTGLMDSAAQLQGQLGAYVIILIVSTVVVMAVSGMTAQAVINRSRHKEEDAHE